MDNGVKMYSQVAAAAGVTEQQAQIACYVLTLSRSGKTLDEACALMRMERPDARKHARSWSIRFSDYPLAAQPTCLTWTKEKRGRWVLLDGGREVAEALSDGKGTGGYVARIIGYGGTHEGSSADVAIARCSEAIEHACVHVVGAEDVEIYGPKKAAITRLAPIDIGDRYDLQKALHA